MSYIGYGVVCLVLLLFVRGTFEKLHPLLQVVVCIILFAEIFQQWLRPIFTQLAKSFTMIPYSHSILYTAFLLLISQLLQNLLEGQDEEAIGQAVAIAVRASLVWMWIVQLKPAVTQMTALLQKFN